MDKEKEIDELHYLIKELACRLDRADIEHEWIEGQYPTEKEYAKALIDAGYRKADEVRKETAKEIFQEWHSDLKIKGEDTNYVRLLAKMYGVEVEE